MVCCSSLRSHIMNGRSNTRNHSLASPRIPRRRVRAIANMTSLLWSVILIVALFATASRAADGSKDLAYDVGGPLEGPKLPLFPTQHGEDPGYPGCVPALAAEKAQGKTWDAQGM